MNTNNEVIRLAEIALPMFTLKIFNEGKNDEFQRVILSDDRPEWLYDLVYHVHDNMGPDDFIYKTIDEVIEALANLSEGDQIYDIEIETDVYTGRLTAWLSSNLSRTGYLQKATENAVDGGYTPDDILIDAQNLEIDEIKSNVISYLEREVDFDKAELTEQERLGTEMALAIEIN